jgi:hypothetical protein
MYTLLLRITITIAFQIIRYLIIWIDFEFGELIGEFYIR